MEPSTVAGKNYMEKDDAIRTSSTAWLPFNRHRDDVAQRAARVLRIDRRMFELMQVVHYVGDQVYKAHYGL